MATEHLMGLEADEADNCFQNAEHRENPAIQSKALSDISLPSVELVSFCPCALAVPGTGSNRARTSSLRSAFET